jgi:hypothetical protein
MLSSAFNSSAGYITIGVADQKEMMMSFFNLERLLENMSLSRK